MDSEQALRDRSGRLERFFRVDPDNADIACELADVLLQLGEAAEFVATLERLNELNPQHVGLRFRLASAWIATGDYANAAEILSALLDDGIDNLAIRYNLALSRLCLRDAETAARIIEPLHGRESEYQPLLLLDVRIQYAQRKYETALDTLLRYQELQPTDPEAVGLSALLLLDSGKTDAARTAAEKALSFDPECLEALLAAAGVAIAQNRMTDAEELSARALARHPQSGRAWSLQAQAQLAHADHDAAMTSLFSAVEFMPDHIGTWHMLAWCQLLNDQIDHAEDSFQRAYEIDRNFDETHGGLAVIAALRGDIETARKSVRRAQGLNPACYSARYAESLLLEREGKDEPARKIIDDVLNGPSPTGTVPLAELINQLAASRRNQG